MDRIAQGWGEHLCGSVAGILTVRCFDVDVLRYVGFAEMVLLAVFVMWLGAKVLDG